MQTPIKIPNRSLSLPTLYNLQSHPLVPDSHKRIFLWEVNPSISSALEMFKNAAKYGAPPGGPGSIGKSLLKLNQTLILLIHPWEGFLVLQPGDYLFARDITGSCDPRDDILVGFQVDQYALSPCSSPMTLNLCTYTQQCLQP